MSFNNHSRVIGQHALLSPSNPHWLNYDEDRLDRMYHQQQVTRRGSDLHDLSMNLIRLGVKLPESPQTLNMYVNDAIGYRMTPEQPLYYSEFCFGTTDAICFRNNLLRIHDLKTGINAAKMEQLLIYAALFCLEYHMKPTEIGIELRIYQNDKIEALIPEPSDVIVAMDRIITHSARLQYLREETM